VKDLAVDAAASFFNAFAKTTGEKTAELLFKQPEKTQTPKQPRKAERSAKERSPMASVHFNLGAEVPPNELNALALTREVLEFVKQHGQCTAVVMGHTDRLGSGASNLRLSEKRALSIASILRAIPRHRLQLKACGEDLPTRSTDDNVPDSENRRVDVVAVCEGIDNTNQATTAATGKGSRTCIDVRG
jgi:outer membrane protein OmpA-like peptidoglycan-associated protein